MDKLTNQLQGAIADAQSLAVGKDHSVIEPVHLIKALVDQRGGSTRPLLQKAGANLASLTSELTKQFEQLPTVANATGDVHMSNELARLLNTSDKLAQKRNDAYISSEMVLLAALEVQTAVKKVFEAAGLTKAALESAINEVRGGESVNQPEAEESRQA
ncbi:Clp protease N-terminal domain-containing protein, partial [Aequoribacter sp.]|uniref:Clp protease N-terminal domain-containing protein n=1 Tax=Aequoribacter sp. TaxID=2847771 RepID=UPI003C5B3CE1